jgi:4-hydroxybenzoate polyprenyltransferase|tara:strand:- start:90 stop:272 length:183 start_codon:yes stop_codon:yes gene_type:complete
MKNENMEFKEILIKMFLALISIVFVILYFVMDNNIYVVLSLVCLGLSYAYDYNLKRKKKK